jgi:PAS domain S-box-containing protein
MKNKDQHPSFEQNLSALNQYGPSLNTGTSKDPNNKALHESFRMNEPFFKQVLESLEDYAVFTTDTDGIISSWNRGAELILGYNESEILGKNADLFYTNEDRAGGIMQSEMLQAIEHGRARDERFHVRKDGSLFWVSGLMFPLKDEQETLRGFTKVMRDLTSHQQAQQTILEAEERFRLIAQATNDVIWDWNLKTNKIWWNAGIQTLYGYAADQVEPGIESWYTRIHPDDYDRILESIHKIIDTGGKQWKDKYRFLKADGSYAYIMDRGYVLHDEKGQPYRMLGSMMDITEQVKAEAVLQESRTKELEALAETERQRQQLFKIFEQAPIAIAIFRGENHVIELANPTMCSIWGKAPEDVLNKPLFSIFPSLEEQGFEALFHKIHETGEPLLINELAASFELGEKNEKRYFNMVHLPFNKEQSSTKDMLIVGNEVSAQVKARQQIEENTRRFQSLADALPNMVWIADANGEVNYYNQQWYNYTGQDYNSAQGQGWEDTIHPEDLHYVKKKWQHSIETGKPYHAETRHKRKDGHYNWFLNRGLPFKNDQGIIQNWFGTCTDIQDKKTTEQSLQESEVYFRAMADSVPVVIWVCNTKGQCTYLNKQWYNLTGQRPEEGFGYGWLEAVHPDDFEKAKATFIEANEKRIPFYFTYRLKTRDGEYRWAIDAATPKFNEKGEFEGLVGSVIDIHERKIAEEAQQQLTHKLALLNKDLKAYNLRIHKSNTELVAANSALSRLNADLDNFVYTVSHDLKAPLANLEGLLFLLKRTLSDQLLDDDRQILDMISVSFNRFKETIGGLIEVINAQHHLHTEQESVSINEVMQDVHQDVSELIEKNNASLVYNFEVDQIPFARVNLHSILLNLLSNALKYRSPERRPEISIKTYHEDNSIVLLVEDNGMGINEKHLPKLFSMFKRFHTHIEGTGVGLYIIKRLIETHGGQIRVESQEGSGSSFYVYFNTN